MSLFDEETRVALIELFTKFPRKLIDYLVIGEDCHTCNEAKILAEELARLSASRVEFKIINKDDNEARILKPRYVPAWIYDTPGKNIRYYGLPSGQEFPPFIFIHQYIATGELKIPKKIIDAVKKINTPLHVKIFVTPECPYCPHTVDLFNQIGLVNEKILVETIEAFELPEEADKYRVEYVPAVIISDVERIDGYAPPDIVVKSLEDAEKKLKGLTST